MARFNMGDRVVVAFDSPFYREGEEKTLVNNSHFTDLAKGDAGTVDSTEIDSDGDLRVKWNRTGDRTAISPDCLALEGAEPIIEASSTVAVREIERVVKEYEITLTLTFEQAKDLYWTLDVGTDGEDSLQVPFDRLGEALQGLGVEL